MELRISLYHNIKKIKDNKKSGLNQLMRDHKMTEIPSLIRARQ